jgi:hypothetical protein
MTPRVVSLATAVLVLPALALATLGGHRFIPDDVYFYLKISDAIARGAGSTFNGLVPTNGYHPLWMLVCVAARFITGADPALRIQAHLAISALGNLLAVVAAYGAAKSSKQELTGLAVVLIAAYVTFNPLGSELHVSLPLLLVAVRLALQRSSLVLLGAVLGLATLARLDNVFVTFALGVAAIVPRNGEARAVVLRRGAMLFAAFALVLAPYLAWNVATFGHLVPISGAIKRGLAEQAGWHPEKLGRQAWLLTAVCVAAVPFAWRWARARQGDSVSLAVCLGALAHATYALLRMEAIWPWYFAGELITAAFALDFALVRVTRELSIRSTVCAVACALALLALPAIAVGNARTAFSEDHPWYLDAARFVDANVPRGAAVAASCSPGALAFFSHRAVFALDGLTGDYAFHERASRDGLEPALRELGVTAVFSIGPDSRELPPLFARTRAIGHGGEGPSFEGQVNAAGMGHAARIGLYSAITRRSVGWLATNDANLIARCPCSRDIALWKLAAGP